MTANGASGWSSSTAPSPTITWFDSPVIVDNLTGGTITKAA